jgi:hypothetical protein
MSAGISPSRQCRFISESTVDVFEAVYVSGKTGEEVGRLLNDVSKFIKN